MEVLNPIITVWFFHCGDWNEWQLKSFGMRVSFILIALTLWWVIEKSFDSVCVLSRNVDVSSAGRWTVLYSSWQPADPSPYSGVCTLAGSSGGQAAAAAGPATPAAARPHPYRPGWQQPAVPSSLLALPGSVALYGGVRWYGIEGSATDKPSLCGDSKRNCWIR